jgi:hypothetical protein
MKPVKVVVYLLILGALAAYVYVVEVKQKEQRQAAETKANKIVQMETDKVVRVELLDGDQTKALLQKPADTWVLNAPVKAKADVPMVNSLLSALAEAQPDRVVLEKDVKWEEYGLDKPEFVVVVGTPEKKLTLSFGASNPAKTSYYLRVDDSPKLLLVPDTLKTSLNKSVFDLRDKTVIRFAQDDVDRIVVTKIGSEIELERKGPSDWVMARPESFAVKSTAVNDDIRTLTNLRAKQVIDEPAKENDPYGLDKPVETISLTGKKMEQTLLLGKSSETKDQPAKEPDRYARIKGEDAVYVVDGRSLKSLKTDPDELRDRSLLNFNPADIEKVEIGLDGKQFTAVKNKDKDWNLEIPETKGPIDSWKITGIIWDIRDLAWKSLTKPIPQNLASVYLDKPQLVVSLFKKDDKQPLVIKAGWNPESSKPKGQPASPAAEPPAPQEKPTSGEAATPTAPIPETVYVLAEPAVEPGAVLMLDGGFLGRLRGELRRLTDKR